MINQLLGQALKAHQEGDTDLARALYQSILSKQTNCADALHLLGILEMQSGNPEESIQYLYEATTLCPENPTFWMNLGNVLRTVNRWNEAQSSWNKVLIYQPENVDAMANIGISFLAMGQRKKAVSIWSDALQQNPDHVESLINLGMISRENEDCGSAHKLWKRALLSDPENRRIKELLSEVKGELGIQALGKRELKIARRLLINSTELNPNDPRNWAYLAELHLLMKKYKLAFWASKKAIALVPEKPEYHHTMGNIFRMTGQNDQALEAYKRAKKLGSTHPATYRSIAELSGEQLAEDPQLVRQLFNQYADNFDEDLQQKLEYSTPLIAYKSFQLHGTSDAMQSILDLGCGTGLSILPFISGEQHTVGVDISENMLEIADKKGIYSKLFVNEISAHLQQEKEVFQLILCLDTLVYIQELKDVFLQAHRCVSENGFFVCSTEKSKGKKPTLQSSGRYAHPQKYMEKLIAETGWKMLHREEANLRKDGDVWIRGNIWVLQQSS
jgi:predicted TPR repeat methyltransferase